MDFTIIHSGYTIFLTSKDSQIP